MHKLGLLFGLACGCLTVTTAFAGPSLLPQEFVGGGSSANAPAALPTSSSQTLIPFAEAAPDMRLVGEDDTRRLTFYLSAEQAEHAGSLRIAYVNAVSILPDDAALSVALNGHPVTAFAIRSPQGVTANDVKVEPKMLVRGWNTVTIRARQHHRVDCSLEGVYELWTQVDAVASGFMSEAAATADDAAALMAAGRTPLGTTELRIVTSSQTMESTASQSLATIQSLALLIGRSDLKVTFSDTSSDAPGIELYFGDPANRLQSPEIRDILSSAPEGLSARNLGQGRVRVVMRGASEQAFSSSLVAALSGTFQPVLSGRQAARQGSRIMADQPGRASLADLGYRTEPFAGRLFRTSFEIVMPEDLYPGDYATIGLRLSAATAPKLAPGAQLVVRVNEKAVTSHPLYAPDGATLRDKSIDLPLRAFHPGVNKVDILAELPRESDMACDPATRDEQRPRFLLLEETALDIPELAHAGRLPDLSALAGRAYPFNRKAGFDLFVDQPTAVRLGAAATVLARLALSAEHPLAAKLKLGHPQPNAEGSALVISAGGTELAASDIVSRKSSRLTSVDLDELVTASVSSPTLPASGDSGSETEALLDAFQASTAADHDAPSVTGRLLTGLQKGWDIVNRWLEYRDAGDKALRFKASDVLVTLSQTRGSFDSAAITSLKAANEDDLQEGVEALTEPATWARLSGGSAVLLRSDHAVVSTPPAVHAFYPLTDTRLSNLRLLAAAWLSDHFAVYVGLVVVLIGAFGLWLGYTIPRKGVRTVP